jgi:ribosome biogenesis GTPase
VEGSLTPENYKQTELLGTVIAVQANFYQVSLDSRETLLCTRPTRLKKIGQKVMVGDRVRVKSAEFERGAIAEVLPRKTELSRPPMANAEQILLLFALEEPSLDPVQLSRFLVKAESTNLNLCLGLNKVDLINQKKQETWQKRITNWGYNSIFFSAINNQGLDKLMEYLQAKITIIAGPSGVGKSSLISALIPEVYLRIGAVSGKLQKGRHTTRHVELYQLPNGGFIADSPGFNQPDIENISPESLAAYFPEAKLRLREKSCKFSDCLHRDEPGCVVRGNWERYDYYRKFLDETIAKRKKLAQMPDEESTLKYKVTGAGKRYVEPKLATKKYRRISRRSKHQKLHSMYENQSLDTLEDENELREDFS